MNDWKKCRLGDICYYGKDRIDVVSLNKTNYISTENMLPDRGGITEAANLPTGMQTPYFGINDTLVSNIRPYFKKVWKAAFSGGCSADVLIFKSKDSVEKDFLYYILSNDEFFDYCMATSKGTKMPRGDKVAIMNYSILLPPITVQRRITAILSALDNKIELNARIIANLEQQAQAIFIELFGNKISDFSNAVPLGELVTIIDNRGRTPPIENELTPYPIIDVKALSGNNRVINYNNCTKYVNEDTFNHFFRSGHPKELDILLSTVGSIAELKFFLGNIGCIAQNVVGLRSTKISPFYLYQYLYHIKNDIISYDIGSVQPSIKVTHIIKHLIYVPTDNKLKLFDKIAQSITYTIYNYFNEINNLVAIRDALLPKLMSGEINV